MIFLGLVGLYYVLVFLTLGDGEFELGPNTFIRFRFFVCTVRPYPKETIKRCLLVGLFT